jgi:hypothetical protein
MSDHFFKRNPDNEPVCSCGFRPEILDDAEPVGKLWKAKTAVLNHAAEMNGYADQTPAPAPFRTSSAAAPFRTGEDVKYPRAGVRQLSDGRWLLTFWDGDRVVDVTDPEDRIHPDRYTAFAQGWLTVGACRQSGTNLNGMESA